jgi:hypothetical protein
MILLKMMERIKRSIVVNGDDDDCVDDDTVVDDEINVVVW